MRTLIISALAAVGIAGFGTPAEARDHCGGHSHFHGCSSFGLSFGVPIFYSRPAYYGYYPRYAYPRYYSSGYGYGYGYRTYRASSSALDVQAALANRGYYYGEIDGIIGPQSRNAIRRYQVDYGLPVTGVIDYPLLRSLGI